MKINNLNNYNLDKQKSNKQISSKGFLRNTISNLANPDTLTSIVTLETAVTSGRSANAYKRGGFAEFRERFTDDFVSAIFWIKGVDIFNTLGNKFGEKVLKLPTTEFDVGKDALRTPFENVVADLKTNPHYKDNIKSVEKKLATFKFTKIIASTLLATGFVGFILPKMNQAITNKLFKKPTKDNTPPQKNTVKNNFNPIGSIYDFPQKTANKKNIPFKGLETINVIAHSLENNKICKLLTSDVGILSGRVSTARNKDEGLEYLFRDASSSFFYFASTPLIYKLLQKASKSSDLTSIDTMAAESIYNNMLSQLKNPDNTFKSMPVAEFAKKTIGILDDSSKELLESLPFNSDVISLTELSKHITDSTLLDKAQAMSQLQPEQAVLGSVLTKQQVADVLKNGSINEPKFMQGIFGKRFGKALTSKEKYIPMKKITKFRDEIDKFAQAVIDTANKKNNGIVDKQLLDKINKNSFIKSAAFRIFAIACSAFALGVVIPKVQYAITAKRTGKKGAPGLREYEQKEDLKNKKA